MEVISIVFMGIITQRSHNWGGGTTLYPSFLTYKIWKAIVVDHFPVDFPLENHLDGDVLMAPLFFHPKVPRTPRHLDGARSPYCLAHLRTIDLAPPCRFMVISWDFSS